MPKFSLGVGVPLWCDGLVLRHCLCHGVLTGTSCLTSCVVLAYLTQSVFSHRDTEVWCVEFNCTIHWVLVDLRASAVITMPTFKTFLLFPWEKPMVWTCVFLFPELAPKSWVAGSSGNCFWELADFLEVDPAAVCTCSTGYKSFARLNLAIFF